MNWIILSFMAAFFLSTSDVLSKRALRRLGEDGGYGSGDLLVAWARQGYALPFLLPILFFIEMPALDWGFWSALGVMLPLEITAILFYVRAIRVSPLSLTVPFLALSPVFIIFIAFAVLGELPDKSGVSGIALIAFGAYLLNVRAASGGDILGPIKAVLKEPGSVLMIIVALIYAVTSTFSKVAMRHSSPLFFAVFYPLVVTLLLSIILASKGRLKAVASRPSLFLPIGFFSAMMIAAHFSALSLVDVAYMISIKRTSLIFSVIYGALVFKEEKLRERLVGAGLMFVGVALITLF
jgi:uncharacterized membrane protein